MALEGDCGAVFWAGGGSATWSVAYRSSGDRAVVVAGGPAVVGVAGAKADSAGKRNVWSWQTSENKKVVHCSDGSIVILNRHSALSYKAGAAREVTLNGEACFRHRSIGRSRLFLVHTGSIVTRVLGTALISRRIRRTRRSR